MIGPDFPGTGGSEALAIIFRKRIFCRFHRHRVTFLGFRSPLPFSQGPEHPFHVAASVLQHSGRFKSSGPCAEPHVTLSPVGLGEGTPPPESQQAKEREETLPGWGVDMFGFHVLAGATPIQTRFQV